MKDLRIVIPALNEASAIADVIGEIPAGLVDEIVVVNNNSTDNTCDVARRSGATVVDEVRRGYGFACMRGVSYLGDRAKKPDIVVFLDADHSDYPDEMKELIRGIVEQNCDLAIGCRSAAGNEIFMPAQQIWGNRLAIWLIKLLYGRKFRDLGPFRAIKFSQLVALDMQEMTYGWTAEMQVKAVRRGMRICEFPVHYRKRIGRSKISGTFRGTILAGYKIISSIIKYR